MSDRTPADRLASDQVDLEEIQMRWYISFPEVEVAEIQCRATVARSGRDSMLCHRASVPRTGPLSPWGQPAVLQYYMQLLTRLHPTITARRSLLTSLVDSPYRRKGLAASLAASLMAVRR